MRIWMPVMACLALGACSGESDEDAANKAAAAAPPAAMSPGQYATDVAVKAFRSTDGQTPAIKAKVGDKSTGAGCVAAGALPPPELFAGADDKCTYKTNYIKDGMINAALDCTTKGVTGQVQMNIQGSYTATGFEASVDTNTFLPGPGDFAETRAVKGRLTGPTCAAPPADGDKAGAKAKAS